VQRHCGDVVVVDDDTAFRSGLISILQRAGYATLGVASAEEALPAIAERRPDVVLTEVILPGVSGYELCRELKDAHGDAVAVMIVSGRRSEPFDRAAGILLGADDYMIKPVDAGELLARVWRLASRATGGRATRGETRSAKLDGLSARERQVLDLLAAGLDQDAIAEALFISPKTVATHIQRILTKLGVHNRTQAVAIALRREPA
jgi:DNA-binding NarL/FixJ family response regulator